MFNSLQAMGLVADDSPNAWRTRVTTFRKAVIGFWVAVSEGLGAMITPSIDYT